MGFYSDNQNYCAAVYIRLSREDGDKIESNSVVNQREFIHSYLKTRPEIQVCSEYVDDGFSGVSFERPAVKKLFQDIKKGFINCVVVKDLSRFGRNYIETGRYIEQIFPFLGVRFIAINDGFDSAFSQSQVDSMVIPFKNLMNDAYSRDISIKVRSQLESRYKKGDYIGAFPVYGYVRSVENKHRLAIDEYAATTIRYIFKRKIEGYSNQKIAEQLNERGVLSPLEYKRMLGWAFSTSFKLYPKAKWSAQSVGRILQNEIYTGTMVQGKVSSPNYKVKKKFINPSSNWYRVEGTHKAIITKQEFDLVKHLMEEDTRIAPKQKEVYLFSGILKCGKCHKSMIRRSIKRKEYIYYICRTQKADKEKCEAHRIREDSLSDCVLEVIKKQISLVCTVEKILEDITIFSIYKAQIKQIEVHIKKKQEEYEYYQNLIIEVYKDYKKNILNQDNYLSMKGNYEKIRDEILKELDVLKQDLDGVINKVDSSSEWIENFKKYQNIEKLNRAILAVLVDKIEIIDKYHIQIYYNFTDEIKKNLCFMESVSSLDGSILEKHEERIEKADGIDG